MSTTIYAALLGASLAVIGTAVVPDDTPSPSPTTQRQYDQLPPGSEVIDWTDTVPHRGRGAWPQYAPDHAIYREMARGAAHAQRLRAAGQPAFGSQ